MVILLSLVQCAKNGPRVPSQGPSEGTWWPLHAEEYTKYIKGLGLFGQSFSDINRNLSK